MHDEEIMRLQNTIQNSKRVHEEDSKWLALLSKVIPDFDKHEKQALSMVNEYGINGALRATRNNKESEPSASTNTDCECSEGDAWRGLPKIISCKTINYCGNCGGKL